MVANQTSLLTERQTECIRLVGDGLSDKEIAIELGIGHETVKTHITRAMKLLGVSSRHQAARMLLEADYQRLSPQPVTPPEAIAPPPDLQPFTSTSAALVDETADNLLSVDSLREEHPAFSHEPTPGWRKPPFPTRGRPRNDLRWWQVVAWVVTLTAVLAIATGVVTNGTITAAKIFVELTH